MRYSTLLAGFAALALGACAPGDQPLPFETSDEVTREIGPEGGTISNAAGASVMIPAGALSTSTTVELWISDVVLAIYAPDAGPRFGLSPAGTHLNVPAEVQLRLPEWSDAWLASVVNSTATGFEEIGDTRVDLSAGIASAEITEFGTLSLVIPAPDAVFQVGTASASQAIAAADIEIGPGGTDSITVGCGVRGDRCDGLTTSASANLLDRVEDAAAIFPVATGTLRLQNGSATGEVRLSTSFRLKMKSGQIAENVTFAAHVEPTSATVVTESSTEIILTNVAYRISETGAASEDVNEFIDTLVIPKTDAADGSITLSRDFQIRGDDGQVEAAMVSITIPVQLY